MAISFDGTSRFIGAPGGSSKTLSHTVGVGNDPALFVGVNIYNSGSDPDKLTSVTYNGVTMNQLTKVLSGAGGDEIYLYYLLNPSYGANNIVATTTGTMAELDIIGQSYFGVGSIDTSNQASASGSPKSISLTTGKDNCWVCGFFASDSGNNLSAGTSTTMRTATGLFAGFDNNAAKTPPGSVALATTFAAGNASGVIGSFAPVSSNFLVMF